MRRDWTLLSLGLCLLGAAWAVVRQGEYLVFSTTAWFVPALATVLGSLGILTMVCFAREEGRLRLLVQPHLLSLKDERLPRKSRFTYVGRGFRWSLEHTRKLYELSASGEIERIKRRFAHLVRFGAGHYIHGVGREEDLFVDNSILSQHTLVIGTTGAGKTRLMELLIRQAIERGEAVIIVDPKGDPDRRLLRRVIGECEKAGRLEAFRLFDLTDPHRSVRYNPLRHFVYAKQLVSRIVASMPREGDSATFRDFAYKVVNAVVNALYALDIKITLARIYEYSDNIGALVRCYLRDKYAGWFKNVDKRDVVKSLIPEYLGHKESGVIQGSPELDEIIKIALHPSEHFQKMLASLFPLFSKLCTGPDRALLSNDNPDVEELSWEGADKQKLVVYLYLGSNADIDRATAVGRMALLDLQSYLGTKYAYMPSDEFEPISIFVDELHAVLTEEYISIVNQARGAGFRIVMGAQTFSDLEHVLRSRAAARRVLGNANIVFQLHVEEEEDAKLFSSRCGKRLVNLAHQNVSYEPALLKSGKEDVEDFRSTFSQGESLKEIDLVPAWAIQDLPVGHYFARWGGVVYKGLFPFLPEPKISEADLERIIKGRYAVAEVSHA